MPTETIHRHYLGALILALYGAAVMGILVYLSFTFAPTDQIQWLIGGAAVIVGLVTIVSLVVYHLNKIVLSASGIEFIRYNALFARPPVEADWNTVQRIEVQTPGILGTLLHFGTLTVVTAGSSQNLVMTYVPSPEAWKEYIDANATFGGVGGV